MVIFYAGAYRCSGRIDFKGWPYRKWWHSLYLKWTLLWPVDPVGV
jgi:hypothetical protein